MRILMMLLLTVPTLASAEVIKCNVGKGQPGGFLYKDLEVAAKKVVPFQQGESFGDDWKKYVQIAITKGKISFIYDDTVLSDISSESGICGWKLNKAEDSELESVKITSDDFSVGASGVNAQRSAKIVHKGSSLADYVKFRLNVSESGFGSFTCDDGQFDERSVRIQNCASAE